MLSILLKVFQWHKTIGFGYPLPRARVWVSLLTPLNNWSLDYNSKEHGAGK